MNDARLNVAIALTAAAHGATVVNHTEVLRLLKQPNPFRSSEATQSPEVAPTHTESSPVSSISVPSNPDPQYPSALDTHAQPLHPPTTPFPLPNSTPQETATDAGVSLSSPAEPSSSSSQTPQPSFQSPRLPPPTPSPPPSPDTPFGKLIEAAKSFITGSSKNKATEADARLLGDHLVSGAVVKDSILESLRKRKQS
jgi:hypothetical protein